MVVWIMAGPLERVQYIFSAFQRFSRIRCEMLYMVYVMKSRTPARVKLQRHMFHFIFCEFEVGHLLIMAAPASTVCWQELFRKKSFLV